MKKIVFVLVLVVALVMSISAFGADRTNLAEGKPAEADVVFSDEYIGQFLFDGDLATKWCGEITGDSGNCVVDLGQEYVLDSYMILHANAPGVNGDGGPEGAHINTDSWNVWVSTDNANWTMVDSREFMAEDVSEYSFDPISARYVKLEVTVANPVDPYIRIYEMEVYGEEPVPQTSDAGTFAFVGMAIMSAGAILKLRKK